MLILIVLSLAYAQIQDEQQLKNAACVIFSKYYLQSNQELAGRTVAEMVQQQGLTQEDAILFAVASLVESCLDSISTQQTMDIIQSLQQQKINLEAHKHLVEKADLKKYGSKKKSAKKNEILKIIKSIDDLVKQQQKEYEGGDGNDQQDGGRKRQRNQSKQQDLSDFSIFELKEWLVLSSFFLVGVLLSYIICCVPERNKKQKKQKNKVKSQEQDDDRSESKKQVENQQEDEDSPKKVVEGDEKQKVE
ncbi:unnamed protein product [Paramecium pentaurelia]|uniref:Transmembrane protein n=1 Tax=Paramecium pentaurelia TaxID=43138 RepID=A0A8S1SXM1_9CILI|nr:unnamed protein product [Paramecium pentaurelia]